MKKHLLGILVLGILSLAIFSGQVWAAEGSVLDSRLKLLLNDETDPFFPDTIRYNFLGAGMKKCANLCKYAATIRTISYVVPRTNLATSIHAYNYDGLEGITIARGIKLEDSDYALQEIRHRDIGQKRIATSSPLRYWYVGVRTGSDVGFGIYNAASESTNVELFLSGIPGWGDTTTLHPAFENETVLYAFYLCKLRQGEGDIANFIRKIATTEILDMKAILENRPFDVTIAKEVISR